MGEESKSENVKKKSRFTLNNVIMVLGAILYVNFLVDNTQIITKEEVPLPQFNPTGNEINCVMETNYGTIEFMLFPEQAPKAVENFVTHAEEGYYDGLTFHRVINDFMIQGGDPNGDGTGGESIWGEPFEDEISDQMYHFRGAICYANAGKDTNGSQFYIVQTTPEALVEQGYTTEKLVEKFGYPQNVAEKYMEVGGTPQLDGDYTVFGMVTSGMEVVDEIASVPIDINAMPIEPVIIESITVVE